MKIYLLHFIAFTLIFTSCKSGKHVQSSSSGNKKAVPEITLPAYQYSPGTCGLRLKILHVAKQENSYQAQAKVIRILGCGAGITRSFFTGEEIQFQFRQEQESKLKPQSEIDCIIIQENSLGNTSPKLVLQKILTGN